MVSVRSLMGAVIAVAVAGCATSVASQKRNMTTEEHKQYVVQLEGTRLCGQLGLMDLDTASRGIAYLTNAAEGYVMDPYYIDLLTKRVLSDVPPSSKTCNSFAMHILDRKRQIDQNNAVVNANIRAADDLVRSTTPTRTYCNKIGTQTLCTTN